jgi:tetratricopeptide (TPR) repeat protein
VAQLQRSLTLTRRALAGIAVDPAEVAALIEASAAVFQRLGDDFSAGSVRMIEAVGYLAAGDVDRSARSARTALEHARHCGDRFVQGRVAWIEGLLADAAGDAAGAYRHIERGLVLLDELGMGQEVTVQAALLVDLAHRRGEQALAAQWRTFVAGRSGGLARHDALLMASARNGEGLDARERGELDRALAAHLQALAGYQEAGVTHAVAFTESALGFLAMEMGDLAGAWAHHRAALEAATACGEPGALALALEGIAAGLDGSRAEEAAVLLGAAGGLRGRASDHGEASHRGDVALVTGRLRDLLDPATFTEASGHGAFMGRDEAERAASALVASASWPGAPSGAA